MECGVVMHHIFQILSKLKIFIHVLPQVTHSLNSNARWSGNYAKPDERSMETWCGSLKSEHEADQSWEPLKRMEVVLLDLKQNWLRWNKYAGDAGDAQERLWRYIMDLEISPKPKSLHVLMQTS